ncbi:MAG: hypothetical protein ACOYZ6_02780 [Chloroflexota bacterium]
MTYWMIFLRLAHIFAGVFWVGAALAMYFFINPAVRATAEAGQKFMGHILTQSRFSAAMIGAGLTTVIAGTFLYWIDSDGFTSAWMMAGPGIGFGIGAVFALIGLAYGYLIPRTGAAMGKLAGQFKGAPTPEQQAQMGALSRRMAVISQVNIICLIAATILMAVARYLRF